MALKANIGLKRIGAGTGSTIGFNTRACRASLNQVLARFAKVVSSIEQASVPAVRYALQPIFDKSQIYCPVKTGDLKGSGYLEVRRTGQKVVAEIGYAKGGHPDYAVIVHENLEFFHQPPTQAKYLQRAMEEGIDKVPARLAEYIRRRARTS